MQDKPRYSRVSDILDLAIFMQSKSLGITISDIMERYNVSRRTAERMRDSLLNIFPSIDEIDTADAQKHWGFINYSINSLITLDKEELIGLENLIKRTTNKEIKIQLRKTIEKLQAINIKNTLTNEENIKLLMQTQGHAIKQIPQYKIDIETLEEVKNALSQSKKLVGIYHNKKRILEPLGLIYGEKTYLIAHEKAKGDDIYTYTLHKFKNLKMTEAKFKKHNFNLQEFANRSFGVYQGEILDVELEFDKSLAIEAMDYNFHPTQTIKKQKNGNLLVNFKACGEREIIWHIFKWGKGCKINKPESLKETYKNYLKENLDNY
ncbi:MAG: WYL domain-containing protein [Candidatus Gastranaerophilales bacterium]|nr:WYL domain-containing protein [Candidatus Gastranaerophilales bacterium]